MSVRNAVQAMACGMAMSLSPAMAADVVVTITGLITDEGEVGCALHQSEDSFPTGQAGVVQFWTSPVAGQAMCRFEDVTPGDYAVAASHDLNGNREADTNLVGMPREPWGVSRNVRPSLRAPRFEEARFVMGADDVLLTIEVVR